MATFKSNFKNGEPFNASFGTADSFRADLDEAKRFNAQFDDDDNFSAQLNEADDFHASFGEIQRVTTDDYEDLRNQPQINGVTLIRNKSLEDLGVNNLSMEIWQIYNRVFGGN